MNAKRLVYTVNHGVISHAGLALAGMGLTALTVALASAAQGLDASHLAIAFLNTGVGAYCLNDSIPLCRAKVINRIDRDKMRGDPDLQSTEDIEEIVIEDHRELELLLLESSYPHKAEWGTVLRTERSGNTVRIPEILNPKEAIERGYFYDAKPSSLKMTSKRITEDGFAGFHHWHPKFFPALCGSGAHGANYVINDIDRCTPLGWTNLLTFEAPGGAELIGYNQFNMFLPTNPEKTRLRRASFNDVWNYLA